MGRFLPLHRRRGFGPETCPVDGPSGTFGGRGPCSLCGHRGPPPGAPVAMEGVPGPRGPECRRCFHAHSHLVAQPDGFARDHPELDHAAFRRCGGCRVDRLSVDGEEGGRAGHGYGRGRGARRVGPHPPEQGRAAVGRGLAFGRPLLHLGRGLRQTDVLGCTGTGLRYRPAGGTAILYPWPPAAYPERQRPSRSCSPCWDWLCSRRRTPTCSTSASSPRSGPRRP